jgi:F-type H+-transporting ATPase subunit b
MGGLIDWKQVATQIVGFLLFLWLVRKFAWGPLLATLEARRAKIQGDLDDAEAKKRDAAELRAKLDHELRNIESQARTRIQEAVNDGQRIAADIKSDAQTEARARLARAEAEIEGERAKAQKSLRDDLAKLAVMGAERILRKKLDDGEQRRLIGEFLEEVKEIR